MNIFAVIHNDITACEILRVLQPLQHLRKRGHLTGVATIEGLLKSANSGKRLPWLNADVILMNRLSVHPEDMPAVMSSLDFMRQQLGPSARFIYDTDDDLTNTHRTIYTEGEVLPTLVAFDRVTVTTPYLASVMKKYHPLVTVVPNFIEFMHFVGKEKKAPEDKRITVGLSGSTTHAADWGPLVPALNRLRLSHNVKVLVSGFIPDGLEGYTTPMDLGVSDQLYLPYREYPDILRQYDILSAPLDPVDKFNYSKSNVKFLECSASARTLEDGTMGGVAFVSSSIPSIYTDVVHNETTGLLVHHDTESWYKALARLVEDVKLRNKIAHNAHVFTMSNYDISNHGVWVYEQMFKNVLASPSIYQRYGPSHLQRYLMTDPNSPQNDSHPLQG